MTTAYGFQAIMTAQPGKADELIARLLEADALSDDDCTVFMISRSTSNPDVVAVTEGWTSLEAHDKSFYSDAVQAYTESIRKLGAGEVQYSDLAPVGGKAVL
jgi:quinol monooxygenase YgiN